MLIICRNHDAGADICTSLLLVGYSSLVITVTAYNLSLSQIYFHQINWKAIIILIILIQNPNVTREVIKSSDEN